MSMSTYSRLCGLPVVFVVLPVVLQEDLDAGDASQRPQVGCKVKHLSTSLSFDRLMS